MSQTPKGLDRRSKRGVMTKTSSATLLALLLAGCNNQPDVQPTISLSQAMIETVDALAAARAEGQAKQTSLGYYPCSVQAVYNISATLTKDNKVGLGVSGGPPAAIAPVSVNLSGSNETTTSAVRGNTITLVFDTGYCLPQGGGAAAGAAAAAAGAPHGAANAPSWGGLTPPKPPPQLFGASLNPPS